MDYGTRLRNLNLQSLEYRRVFFDLVMCYKIVFHLVMSMYLTSLLSTLMFILPEETTLSSSPDHYYIIIFV